MADETTEQPTPTPEAKGPDLTKAIEGLLAKHGDPNAALRVLLNENYQARDAIRDLKTKLPAEGAVVLAGDDASAWSAYRQLGKPDDLRTGLSERDTARAELAGLRKAETTREVAGLHGLKAPRLAILAKDVDFEIKEETGKDGKAVRVAHVKGEGGTTTPVLEHFKEFLDSLKDEPVRSGPAPRTGHTPPRPEITPAAPRKRFGGI